MLKFIGYGSAFNTELGNNSAYIKDGSTLFLIDCGSNTFDRIRKMNLLDGVEKIYVLITHTHPDHVGSLGDLIFYSYYSMGEIMKPCLTVLAPKDVNVMITLKAMGVRGELYNFVRMDVFANIDMNGERLLISALKVNHVPELTCYGYGISFKGDNGYYSGDSNEIPSNVLELLKGGWYDYFYQDTCKADYEGNVHLSLRKLDELVDKSVRDRVYCMHLDESFDINEARNLGFKTVTPIDYREGDIFNIEGKDYALRFINKLGGCWLEPILYRNSDSYVSGGLNKTVMYEDLDNFELIDRY